MTIFNTINLIVTILWVALFLREIKLMKELEEIVTDIENEVYAFLFKGKKAQLELFGVDGEPAPGLDAELENEAV